VLRIPDLGMLDVPGTSIDSLPSDMITLKCLKILNLSMTKTKLLAPLRGTVRERQIRAAIHNFASTSSGAMKAGTGLFGLVALIIFIKWATWWIFGL